LTVVLRRTQAVGAVLVLLAGSGCGVKSDESEPKVTSTARSPADEMMPAHQPPAEPSRDDGPVEGTKVEASAPNGREWGVDAPAHAVAEIDEALELGGERATLKLINLLMLDHDADVRMCAARALGDRSDANAIPALIGGLIDLEVRVQRASKKSLIALAGREVEIRPGYDEYKSWRLWWREHREALLQGLPGK
jgi:HEAT repeat protein